MSPWTVGFCEGAAAGLFFGALFGFLSLGLAVSAKRRTPVVGRGPGFTGDVNGCHYVDGFYVGSARGDRYEPGADPWVKASGG